MNNNKKILKDLLISKKFEERKLLEELEQIQEDIELINKAIKELDVHITTLTQ